jgi:hypothetical protein
VGNFRSHFKEGSVCDFDLAREVSRFFSLS